MCVCVCVCVLHVPAQGGWLVLGLAGVRPVHAPHITYLNYLNMVATFVSQFVAVLCSGFTTFCKQFFSPTFTFTPCDGVGDSAVALALSSGCVFA